MKFSGTITLQYDTIFSPFTANEWEKSLEWLQESGFDGAEVCIANYDNFDVENLKNELDKKNLKCSTISTGQARGMEGLSLIGVSEDIVKKTQERFMQHIDTAKILGSKVTIGLMRGVGSIETMEQDLDDLAEAMKPIIAYAEEKGVKIILEAINRYETCLLNSAETTVDFIKNKLGDTKTVGILWDLFHANIEDQSFEESIDIMGDRLQHIHIADSNRSFPTYGNIDFKKILDYAKQKGFTEYASFECLNRPSKEIVIEKSKMWIEEMKK